MAISLPFGSGNSGTNDWADVYSNDAQLVTEIDDRDGNYQTILAATAGTDPDRNAGTYLLSPGATLLQSGGTLIFGGVPGYWPSLVYFDDADYAVSSKTQKLRLRAQVNTNATAWSSVTATFGLYPVTFAGAADVLSITLGTVVSGSTAAIANPGASATSQGNSGDFTIPADGQYALGVATSATMTNNAVALLTAQLQTRWV